MAKARLPRAGKNNREAALSGGPWSGHTAVLPRQNDTDPMSLPIRVGEHAGRYNLNTGAWTPLTGENA